MVLAVYTQDNETLWCPQNRGQCHVTALLFWNHRHRRGHAVAILVTEQHSLLWQGKKVNFKTIQPGHAHTECVQFV